MWMKSTEVHLGGDVATPTRSHSSLFLLFVFNPQVPGGIKIIIIYMLLVGFPFGRCRVTSESNICSVYVLVFLTASGFTHICVRSLCAILSSRAPGVTGVSAAQVC